MSYKQICDLCGKEMTSFDKCRKFKIKGYSYSTWGGWSWVKIDARDRCVRRLFEAVKTNPSAPRVESVSETPIGDFMVNPSVGSAQNGTRKTQYTTDGTNIT